MSYEFLEGAAGLLLCATLIFAGMWWETKEKKNRAQQIARALWNELNDKGAYEQSFWICSDTMWRAGIGTGRD